MKPIKRKVIELVENRLQNDEEKPTLDAEEQKRRIRKRRDAMLENPIVKETPHGGDKIENPDLGYPIEELEELKKKRKVKKATEEEQNPPPVIED